MLSPFTLRSRVAEYQAQLEALIGRVTAENGALEGAKRAAAAAETARAAAEAGMKVGGNIGYCVAFFLRAASCSFCRGEAGAWLRRQRGRN